jgi:hypothetical protein
MESQQMMEVLLKEITAGQEEMLKEVNGNQVKADADRV